MYVQVGGTLPVYQGTRIQRGGGFLSSIGRVLFPVAKKMFLPAAKNLLRETVRAAPEAVDNIMSGRASVGNALLGGVKRAGRNTVRNVINRSGLTRRTATKRRATKPVTTRKRKQQKGGSYHLDVFGRN